MRNYSPPDHKGWPVAVRDLPAIEPPLELRPRTAEQVFAAEEIGRATGPDDTVYVMIDPGETVEEITRRNNRTHIGL